MLSHPEEVHAFQVFLFTPHSLFSSGCPIRLSHFIVPQDSCNINLNRRAIQMWMSYEMPIYSYLQSFNTFISPSHNKCELKQTISAIHFSRSQLENSANCLRWGEKKLSEFKMGQETSLLNSLFL